MSLRPSTKVKVVSVILVLAMFVPAVTGWARDNCCPERGHALPGLESSAPSSLTAKGHDDTDAGPETTQSACSCSLCQTIIARTDVPGIEVPLNLERASLFPGMIPASLEISQIFRPPLA
jgi:hypothetical protein